VAEGERSSFWVLLSRDYSHGSTQKFIVTVNLFKGLCTDGVYVCMVTAREQTKKSILGCTLFDGCMMDDG